MDLDADVDVRSPGTSRASPGDGASKVRATPYLLGCAGGTARRRPLAARIEVTATTVVWRGFRNPHREGWDLSGPGTPGLGRQRYGRALRATALPPRRASTPSG